MGNKFKILEAVAEGNLTPEAAIAKLQALTDVKPRSAEFWDGFDYACDLLDETFAKSHPHKYNIADCLKAKVNRLPNKEVRFNIDVHDKFKQ